MWTMEANLHESKARRNNISMRRIILVAEQGTSFLVSAMILINLNPTSIDCREEVRVLLLSIVVCKSNSSHIG